MSPKFKLKQTTQLGILFVIILVCSLGVIHYFATQNFITQTEQQLNKLDKLFDSLLEENNPLQLRKMQQFTTSEEFVKSVTAKNMLELNKLLNHLKDEIGAQRLLLISPSYEILQDTHTSTQTQQTFPYPHLLNQSNELNTSKTILVLDHILYRTLVQPVTLLNNQYWLISCLEIEPLLEKELSVLSLIPYQMEILYQLPDQHWQWVKGNAPSLDMSTKYIEKYFGNNKNPNKINTINENHHLIFTIPFIVPDRNMQIIALISYTSSDIYHYYYHLYYPLAIILLMGVLIVFSLIYLSLKGMNATIKHMTHAIQNIEKGEGEGEGEQSVPVIGTKEFTELATHFNTMLKDIRTREKELLHQGRHDPTTLLPNRQYFLEYLSQRLSKCDPDSTQMAIVTIAVDRFTQINHTLGHPVGQRLLNHVGARLTNTLTEAEMLGQLNNHVFIALMPNIGPTNYSPEAQKILNAFESPFSVYTVNIDLDALVGFSFYPQDGVDADILMQKADVALYSAKYTPDRYLVYNTEKDPHHFTKLSLMSELREGIAQNEFEVYYQPKIDLKSGKIIQVESLIRWIHPVKGFMSPGLFIPLAEQTGHIKKLTLWLIDKTLEQSAKWHENNLNLVISINLSVKDLLNKELYSYITTCMKTHGVDPSWITLEITESAFMHDPEKAMEAIHKLRDFGFHFSIDDFGTGFSSLSYLKQLPVNELKIDQSFIRDVTKHPRVADLVRSTIDMGHSLKMSVVAEGIEDNPTHELLRSFECDIGQGYLYSKPLNIIELTKWMNSSEWGIQNK